MHADDAIGRVGQATRSWTTLSIYLERKPKIALCRDLRDDLGEAAASSQAALEQI